MLLFFIWQISRKEEDQDHCRDSFSVVIPLLKLINYVKQEAFLIVYKGSSYVK